MSSSTIPARQRRPDRAEADNGGDGGTPIPASLRIDGPMAYEAALAIQERAARERADETRPDLVWLLEHDPVFTAGRNTAGSGHSNERRSIELSGVPVFVTGRGGHLTYHGPGQVVAYPILRLRQHCSGPKAYVRMLEAVLLGILQDRGIPGRRIEGLPGVWVGTAPPEKIASIGVRISNGITTHGLALNVDMDLSPFSLIVPCGIPGCRMTSMSRYLGRPIDVSEIKRALASAFANVLHLGWVDEPAKSSATTSGERVPTRPVKLNL